MDLLGSLAGTAREAAAEELFPHIPLPRFTAAAELCAEQLWPRMHSRVKTLQTPEAPLFKSLSLVKLVRVEVQLMVKLASKWMLDICVASSWNNCKHTHSLDVCSMAAS